MNSTNRTFHSPTNEELYEKLPAMLRKMLPSNLNHVDIPSNSKNTWIGLDFKYSEFNPSYAYYQLHFSKHSKNHAAYFGKGPVNLIAFYFGIKPSRMQRLDWLQKMGNYQEEISSKINKPIVLGEWGDNWAWLAVALSSESISLYHYSQNISDFIQSTYTPIKTALEAVGYL